MLVEGIVLVEAARGEEVEVPRQVQVGLGEDTGVAEFKVAREIKGPGNKGSAFEGIPVVTRSEGIGRLVRGVIVEDRLGLMTDLLKEVVIKERVAGRFELVRGMAVKG